MHLPPPENHNTNNDNLDELRNFVNNANMPSVSLIKSPSYRSAIGQYDSDQETTSLLTPDNMELSYNNKRLASPEGSFYNAPKKIQSSLNGGSRATR